MSWDDIVRMETAKNSAPLRCPGMGVTLRVKRTSPRKGIVAHYIMLRIGIRLARELGLRKQREPIRILLGSGDHAGQIAIRADATGTFSATRNAAGEYQAPINRASGDGLFRFDFTAFIRDDLIIEPGPMTSFPVPAGVLAGEAG